MDLLDVMLAFAAVPTWIGVSLLAGGVFSLGLTCGVWLRGPAEPDDEPDPASAPTEIIHMPLGMRR
jgi:hypothetical protein